MVLDDFRLDGQVAIVTGGSRGIGRAIALAFAEVGADVVATARGREGVEAVAEEIAERGRRTVVVTTDIAQPEEVEALLAATLEELGRVDVLVNNAGINPLAGRVDEVELEDWQRIVGVNLTGTFLCCRTVARHWIAEERGGAIVNLLSVLRDRGLQSLGPYGATKGGLAALTRAMAVDWARFGIRVNAVAPGFVATEMVAEPMANERLNRYLLGKTLMRRYAEPEEMVGACLLLASAAGGYMTGSIVTVDGGWTAQ